uniref:Tyrosine-protein phosphatase domain-containing protein n=1 Tax=Parastrongyloides trichosuri TaxID=131310 RepID=A0A0N4ZMM6_PARTI
MEFDKYKKEGDKSSKNWIFNNSIGFVNPIYEEKKPRNFHDVGWPLPTSRRYHISENPHKCDIDLFWKQVFRRKIKVIINFSFTIPFEEDSQYNSFWLFDSNNLTDYKLEKITKENEIELGIYCIECKLCSLITNKSRNIKVFYVDEWDINSVPPSYIYITKLYDIICNNAKEDSVLFHTSYLPDSRISSMIAFVYIIESMVNDDKINDPLQIIRISKEYLHCGPLDKNDIALIIYNIFEYFSNIKIINNSRSMRKFRNIFINYTVNQPEQVIPVKSEYKNIFSYGLNLSKEKIRILHDITKKIALYNDDELQFMCSNFYNVLYFQNKEELGDEVNYKNVVRYENIPCLNSNPIYNIKDKKLYSDKLIDIFLHGNEFIYKTNQNKERNMIICQSPSQDTIKNFIEMLYERNVCALVIMIEEGVLKNNFPNLVPANSKNINDTIFDYLPDSGNVTYGEYKITKTGLSISLNEILNYSEYSLTKENDPDSKIVNFKAFKFISDINKKSMFLLFVILVHFFLDIISQINSYKLLYTGMIAECGDCNSRHIVIHDHSGVSTSSVMALIIFMIDNISSRNLFNPITSLIILRQRRYMAILYDYQFLFVILFIFEYYFDSSSSKKIPEIENTKQNLIDEIINCQNNIE